MKFGRGNGSTMSDTNLAYAAGLFDGEGTVTLAVGSNPRAFRRVQISLSSTDLCLCELMMEILNGGHVLKKKSRKPERWAQAYEFRWSGTGAKTALEKLRPYLRCPLKVARTDLILDKYDSVTKRNGKYTLEERTKKIEFEAEFFALK